MKNLILSALMAFSGLALATTDEASMTSLATNKFFGLSEYIQRSAQPGFANSKSRAQSFAKGKVTLKLFKTPENADVVSLQFGEEQQVMTDVSRVQYFEAFSSPINNNQGVELRAYGQAFTRSASDLIQIKISGKPYEEQVPFEMRVNGRKILSGTLVKDLALYTQRNPVIIGTSSESSR